VTSLDNYRQDPKHVVQPSFRTGNAARQLGYSSTSRSAVHIRPESMRTYDRPCIMYSSVAMLWYTIPDIILASSKPCHSFTVAENLLGGFDETLRKSLDHNRRRRRNRPRDCPPFFDRRLGGSHRRSYQGKGPAGRGRDYSRRRKRHLHRY